jgi:hypothetical protein
MAGQRNQEESMIQNLKDAGCASDLITRFMTCHEEKKTFEQLRILSKQREVLLDQVHDNQEKLDCLDYLMYKLKKESK